MSSTVGDPLFTGTLYAVSDVDGHPPLSVMDFVGSVEFTIIHHGLPQSIRGTGVPGSSQVLRFYEILESEADVRIWNISGVAGTGIVAYPVEGP